MLNEEAEIPDHGTPAATLTARHPRLIKSLQYLGAAVVFGTLAAVAGWLGYNLWQRAQVFRARHANRDVIVHVLKAADIDEAAGPNGVVLRTRDGSWIA